MGADYYWTFVQDQIIHGNSPTAVRSQLGYLLSGPLLQLSAAVNLVHVNFTAVDDQNLDIFWKAELSGISPSTVDSDDNFLKAYMQCDNLMEHYPLSSLGKRIIPSCLPIFPSVPSVPDPWLRGLPRLQISCACMARLLLIKSAKALLRRLITLTPNRHTTFPIGLSERTRPPHQSA